MKCGITWFISKLAKNTVHFTEQLPAFIQGAKKWAFKREKCVENVPVNFF